jgi:hypothetical protein
MVSLHRATSADAECLSNLLELYIHDVCDIFPTVELADNGRFGYAKLPLYWAEPERRFAFVIRHAERVAGFALATRDLLLETPLRRPCPAVRTPGGYSRSKPRSLLTSCPDSAVTSTAQQAPAPRLVAKARQSAHPAT